MKANQSIPLVSASLPLRSTLPLPRAHRHTGTIPFSAEACAPGKAALPGLRGSTARLSRRLADEARNLTPPVATHSRPPILCLPASVNSCTALHFHCIAWATEHALQRKNAAAAVALLPGPDCKDTHNVAAVVVAACRVFAVCRCEKMQENRRRSMLSPSPPHHRQYYCYYYFPSSTPFILLARPQETTTSKGLLRLCDSERPDPPNPTETCFIINRICKSRLCRSLQRPAHPSGGSSIHYHSSSPFPFGPGSASSLTLALALACLHLTCIFLRCGLGEKRDQVRLEDSFENNYLREHGNYHHHLCCAVAVLCAVVSLPVYPFPTFSFSRRPDSRVESSRMASIKKSYATKALVQKFKYRQTDRPAPPTPSVCRPSWPSWPCSPCTILAQARRRVIMYMTFPDIEIADTHAATGDGGQSSEMKKIA